MNNNINLLNKLIGSGFKGKKDITYPNTNNKQKIRSKSRSKSKTPERKSQKKSKKFNSPSNQSKYYKDLMSTYSKSMNDNVKDVKKNKSKKNKTEESTETDDETIPNIDNVNDDKMTDDIKKINEIIDLLNESDLNEDEIDLNIKLVDIEDEIELDDINVLDIFDKEINNIDDENVDEFLYDDIDDADRVEDDL